MSLTRENNQRHQGQRTENDLINELCKTVDQQSDEIKTLKHSMLKLAEVCDALAADLEHTVRLTGVIQKAVFRSPDQYDDDIMRELHDALILLKTEK